MAIVVYAGASGVVLPSTKVKEKNKIIESLNRLTAGGSTGGEAAIRMAYKIASDNFVENGNNRIILATDGDFNVGIYDVSKLKELVNKKRATGIFLSCLGFGMGNYRDDMVEGIANAGNGNYFYIDSEKEANKVFSQEINSTLYTIAKDVKFQLEFNPNIVKYYKQVGYENRALRAKDFDDDSKDGGEIGVGHSVTILYEIEMVTKTTVKDSLKYQSPNLKNTFENEIATLSLRYKLPEETHSIKKEVVINNQVLDYNKTTVDYKFANSVAHYGLILKASEVYTEPLLEEVLKSAKKSLGEDKYGFKKEFISLIRKSM